MPDQLPPDDEFAAGSPRPSRRPAAAAAVAAAATIVLPSQDDEISIDDPEIEGSGLVGAPVVAQLLGGRVIEERQE
jgi:DNA polymerase III subunit gamma/tau